jgi:hypothetical protein
MKRSNGLLVWLTLCLLGGLIASFFTPAIAATLTLPSGSAQAATTGTPAAPQAEPTLAATVLTTPSTQPTAMPSGTVVLAQDTFQRPDQQFWGTASDGRNWGGDANTSRDFAIVNDAGQISANAYTIDEAIVNVRTSNADLLVSGTSTSFPASGDINLGCVLRWQNSSNWYKLLIDGSHLELLRDLQGQSQILAQVPYKAVGGVSYSLRFQTQGGYLFGKVWQTSQAEPANWNFVVIDTALTTGLSGLRVRLEPGVIVRITSLQETNVPLVTD